MPPNDDELLMLKRQKAEIEKRIREIKNEAFSTKTVKVVRDGEDYKICVFRDRHYNAYGNMRNERHGRWEEILCSSKNECIKRIEELSEDLQKIKSEYFQEIPNDNRR